MSSAPPLFRPHSMSIVNSSTLGLVGPPLSSRAFTRMRRGLIGLFLGSLIFQSLSCGTGSSGGTSLNEGAPDGFLLKQAPFFGQNGQTVSGTAAVYASSGGAFVLRLEGLTAPSESGIQVRVVGNGTQVFASTLKASSGSMNYTMNVTGIATWNSVSLYSTSQAKSYGTATF